MSECRKMSEDMSARGSNCRSDIPGLEDPESAERLSYGKEEAPWLKNRN